VIQFVSGYTKAPPSIRILDDLNAFFGIGTLTSLIQRFWIDPNGKCTSIRRTILKLNSFIGRFDAKEATVGLEKVKAIFVRLEVNKICSQNVGAERVLPEPAKHSKHLRRCKGEMKEKADLRVG